MSDEESSASSRSSKSRSNSNASVGAEVKRPVATGSTVTATSDKKKLIPLSPENRSISTVFDGIAKTTGDGSVTPVANSNSKLAQLPPLTTAPQKSLLGKLPPIKLGANTIADPLDQEISANKVPFQKKPSFTGVSTPSPRVVPIAHEVTRTETATATATAVTKENVSAKQSLHNNTTTTAPMDDERNSNSGSHDSQSGSDSEKETKSAPKRSESPPTKSQNQTHSGSNEDADNGSDKESSSSASSSSKSSSPPKKAPAGGDLTPTKGISGTKPSDEMRKSSDKGTKAKKVKARKMLTSSQLADLFTRLDRDGDGSLDLNEFAGIIKKLRIAGSENFVAKVFKDVDKATGSTGSLDMQAFIAAYHRLSTEIEEADRRGGQGGARKNCFVRATRYGMDENHKPLLHCYHIPSDGFAHKFFVRPPSGYTEKITKVEFESCGTWNPTGDPSKDQNGGAAGVHWQGKLEALSKMIYEDSQNNVRRPHQKVLWWIDVAFDDVDRAAAESLVSSFGLPNNSKFLSSFGNFGNALGVDPKSRMFAGIGTDTQGREVHSLSYFAQTMWIRNVPVVHHLPTFLTRLNCMAACNKRNSTFARAVKTFTNYYTTRFAFLANFAWLNKYSRDEKLSAYQRAEGLATLVKTTNDKDSDQSDSDSDMDDLLNEIMGDEDEEGDDEDSGEAGDTVKKLPKPKPAMTRAVSTRGSMFYATQSAALMYSAMQGNTASTSGGGGSGGGLARSISERFSGGGAQKKGGLHPSNTIFDAFSRGIPVTRSNRSAEPPIWLLTPSAMVNNPPQMRFDSIGMHILDYGFGPHALVTVREFDDEMQPHNTLEQKSRTGVLGRVVAGAWSKVAEVTLLSGDAGGADDIADTPATLVTFLHLLLHNFSMNSCATLDYWLGVLEKEIRDMVVSKHSAHITEIDKLLRDYNAYVDPLVTLMERLTEEREEHMLEMLEEMGQQFFGSMGGNNLRSSVRQLTARRRRSVASNSGKAGVGGHIGLGRQGSTKSAKSSFTKALPGEKRASGRHGRGSPEITASPQVSSPAPPAAAAAGRTGKRKSILITPKFFGGKSAPPPEDEEIEPSLPFPSGIESLTVTFEAINTFFDKDANRELQRSLEGFEQLDIKGLIYWKERLKKYAVKLEFLKDLIQAQLDEKRNFMSFMLTIITTVLAPLSILTGYFGMNFDNMIELDQDTYTYFPGVVIMWFVCAVAYGILLLGAFHFRVIYSAT